MVCDGRPPPALPVLLAEAFLGRRPPPVFILRRRLGAGPDDWVGQADDARDDHVGPGPREQLYRQAGVQEQPPRPLVVAGAADPSQALGGGMSGEVQCGGILQEQEASGLSQGLPRALAMGVEDGLMGDLIAVEEARGGLQFSGPGDDRGHGPLSARAQAAPTCTKRRVRAAFFNLAPRSDRKPKCHSRLGGDRASVRLRKKR